MDPRLPATENVIFRTCRNYYASGNSIQAVRIITSGYFWLEDSNGLVKLNAKTGRAESSYSVPFRTEGDPRTRTMKLSNDDIARNSPSPLGSREAHWIALHYAYLFPPVNNLNKEGLGHILLIASAANGALAQS